LIVASNNALGNATGKTVLGSTTTSGGILRFEGPINYTTPEPVEIHGTIQSGGGDNRFAGPVKWLASALNVMADTGTVLTMDGNFTGALDNDFAIGSTNAAMKGKVIFNGDIAFNSPGGGRMVIQQGCAAEFNHSNSFNTNLAIGNANTPDAELTITADGALGTAGALTGMGPGSQLTIRAPVPGLNYTVPETINLSGYGKPDVLGSGKGAVYITGGNLTFAGTFDDKSQNGSIGVDAGKTLLQQTNPASGVTAKIQGGTNTWNLVKLGKGTWTIHSSVDATSFAGRLVLNEGTVNLNTKMFTINAASHLPTGYGINVGLSSDLNVDTKLVLGADQQLNGLSVGTVPNNPPVPAPQNQGTFDPAVPAGASLAGKQGLDLNNHKIQVYTFGSTTEADLARAIRRGILTSGDGILDSTAATNMGVGITDQKPDDNGKPNILIEKALFGDSNMDGIVDVVDLGKIGTNWQISNVGWDGGDSNYDGIVDIVDLGMVGTNWQLSGAMSFSQALALVGLDGVAVPEPGTMSLLALGAVGLLRQRRRR
jgi:hypothetical protein